MTVIAVSTIKGGCSKTLTSMLLATAFARQGESVSVVDLDPQATASAWARYASAEGDPLPFPVTSGNARTTKSLREKHTFTILDCPPGQPDIIQAAIDRADLVIVPVGPSRFEVEQMWKITSVAGDKAVALVTRALLHANSTRNLLDALDAADMPRFKGAIPQREALGAMQGHNPKGTLHGYEGVARQVMEMING